MEARINYGGSLDLKYWVKFFDAAKKEIIPNILSSEYLSTKMQATYVEYLRLSRQTCYKRQCVAPSARKVGHWGQDREESEYIASCWFDFVQLYAWRIWADCGCRDIHQNKAKGTSFNDSSP